MTASMRVRNFSRRVFFFLSANSVWEKLGWRVMLASLGNTCFPVCMKSKPGGLNQRFPKALPFHPFQKAGEIVGAELI